MAIVFVKANSGEDLIALENSKGDREDLNVWYGGNELIEKVAEVNKNIIVVIRIDKIELLVLCFIHLCNIPLKIISCIKQKTP